MNKQIETNNEIKDDVTSVPQFAYQLLAYLQTLCGIIIPIVFGIVDGAGGRIEGVTTFTERSILALTIQVLGLLGSLFAVRYKVKKEQSWIGAIIKTGVLYVIGFFGLRLVVSLFQ